MFRYLIVPTILIAGLGRGSAISAQPGASKPVLTESVDEPGRSPYQESASPNGTCLGTTFCEYMLSAVPAGKRLVVTYKNIVVSASPGSGVSAYLFNNLFNIDGSTGGALINVPITSSTLIGGNLLYTLGGFTQFYVNAGPSPVVDIEADFQAGKPNVFVSGYYVTL